MVKPVMQNCYAHKSDNTNYQTIGLRKLQTCVFCFGNLS